MRDENSEQSAPDEEIEGVREQDEARLPAGYHQGGNDMTVGIDGQRAGIRSPSNPEDRFEE